MRFLRALASRPKGLFWLSPARAFSGWTSVKFTKEWTCEWTVYPHGHGSHVSLSPLPLAGCEVQAQALLARTPISHLGLFTEHCEPGHLDGFARVIKGWRRLSRLISLSLPLLAESCCKFAEHSRETGSPGYNQEAFLCDTAKGVLEERGVTL